MGLASVSNPQPRWDSFDVHRLAGAEALAAADGRPRAIRITRNASWMAALIEREGIRGFQLGARDSLPASRSRR